MPKEKKDQKETMTYVQISSDINDTSRKGQAQVDEADVIVVKAQQKIIEAKQRVDEVKKALQQNSQQGKISSEISSGWKKVHKPRYEIELYEEVTDDDSGEIKGYKKVPSEHPIYIEAASKADLMEHARRYQFCHQRMKIIRCVDDCSTDSSSQVPLQKQAQSNSQPEEIRRQVQQREIKSKTKPRFYKLGDIEVKEDNGKLYQKQWMKLSKSEASNLRVISDKNNAIVNLNGKHIEMKKWVQIENTEEDDSTNLEDSLNG